MKKFMLANLDRVNERARDRHRHTPATRRERPALDSIWQRKQKLATGPGELTARQAKRYQNRTEINRMYVQSKRDSWRHSGVYGLDGRPKLPKWKGKSGRQDRN